MEKIKTRRSRSSGTSFDPGKLVVVEGIDGSGKSTQIPLTVLEK